MNRINRQQASLVNQDYLTSSSGEYEIRSTKDSIQPYKAHSHRELSIGVVEAGSTCLYFNGSKTEITQEQIVILEPNLVHACNPIDGKPRSYHMIHLQDKWLSEQLGAKTDNKITIAQPVLNNPVIAKELIEIISDLRKHRSSQAHARLLSRLGQLVKDNCLLVDKPSGEPLVAQVLTLLKLDDSDKSLTIKEISQRLNFSEETIIRAFNKAVGVSPKSYSINDRINQAKLLLREGKDITEVALSLGFADQSHFHKSFVRYTASTPQQYKQADQF